ncbi:MAG: hypothetical protein EXQ87_02710 [Alphaproteobacteria bacterium]|nr:hypothetical protein [Alphaproteobacteria bacterium]
MRIVNPSFGLSLAGTEQVTTRPVDWLNDPIVLFTNSKPNAHALLAGIREKLAGVRRIDNIEFASKDSASQPAPAATIDEISGKYRVALLALAD